MLFFEPIQSTDFDCIEIPNIYSLLSTSPWVQAYSRSQQVEVYDPRMDRWFAGPSLISNRTDPAMSLLPGVFHWNYAEAY